MRSKNIEYSTVAEPYCTMYGVKVPFFIPEFSSSSIILHQFHIDNNRGENGIGYDMIIDRNLMVQLGLLDDFKLQVHQWDGYTIPMS